MTEPAGDDIGVDGELSRPPSRERGEGEVHVLGTAHVSEQSVEKVEETIAERKPDVVAVELDEGRFRQLKGETPDDIDPGDMLRGNTVFQFLAYWMLSYVQTRMGKKLGVDPGADMLAAVDAAEEHGLGVALVDRDIQMTVQRFWARLSPLRKISMLGNLTLAIGSPIAVGAGLGLSFGLFAGFALAMVGAGALGFASADFVAALGPDAVALAGGLVGGAVGGVVLWSLLEPWLAEWLEPLPVPDTTYVRVAAGVLVGSAAGVAIAASGGLALGPLAVSSDRLTGLGGFVLQTGTGVLGGAVGGAALGALGGAVLAAFLPDEEELEEIDIDELTDADVVTAMMEEFRRFAPGAAEALIDERDAFIAHRLVALREAGYSVVAVVGAGHREGIERYLADPESLPPMESLVGEASGTSLTGYLYKAVGYLLTVGFVVFFALLALGGASNEWLVELFVAWFIVNAVLAGGLAKLAGATWPSALVGGGVAWLTSVNPLLAPGWFAGYVELRYVDVNVSDIARLNEIMDDETAPVSEIFARMRQVPLFRLILIAGLTNVGSMIASLVVFPLVLPMLSAPIGGVDAIPGLLLDGARNGWQIVWGVVS
ncbi:TraB/GumN family protein [Halosimplex rubrum]|uniref:TraB/GumN family protein n=1 Tax=Halosimplex rubrum TaxID=869889 RepID=A0A7D5P3F6_9EURY|nr:TraB/GumN family protein [Halosimplex rubrum]QLH76525.1 TraB/GumN family protein [Halosimplex rubrum]